MRCTLLGWLASKSRHSKNEQSPSMYADAKRPGLKETGGATRMNLQAGLGSIGSVPMAEVDSGWTWWVSDAL